MEKNTNNPEIIRGMMIAHLLLYNVFSILFSYIITVCSIDQIGTRLFLFFYFNFIAH
jgi:hypothetical protein